MFVYPGGFLFCFLNSENNLQTNVHIFIKTKPQASMEFLL